MGSATYEWLKAEIANSAEDRNSFLDKYDDMHNRITYGYDDDRNYSAQKDRNHTDRFNILFDGFEMGLDTDADKTSARLLLGPLMMLSGHYRLQSLVQAKDAESYLRIRAQVTGINLEDAIYAQLVNTLPTEGDFAKAQITVEGLRRRMEVAREIGQTAMMDVHERLSQGLDLGQRYSLSVNKLKNSQHSWAGFAADVITLAAKHRDGELDAVPFPEPKSISDQHRVIRLGELLE
jgi:hypothetical protein